MNKSLKIAHVSMFAPSRCGLYEASRDMAKADAIAGHIVYFVDVGTISGNKQEAPRVGQVDDRYGFAITTADPRILQECDIIFMHQGMEDKHLVKCTCPLIWVVHGKPLDCFRPEQNGLKTSYSVYKEVSTWQRTKYMLHFWKEYIPFWRPSFPDLKHIVLNYPCIDRERFNNIGDKYTIKDKGLYNVLICDSIRADIDMFELTIGCIEAARQIKGLKFHFFAVQSPVKECWKVLFRELDRLGAMGDINNRVLDMPSVYRAMDLTVSPNRIINRVVAESVCCGTPVLQETPAKGSNSVADYACYIPDPQSVVEGLKLFVNDFNNGQHHKDFVLDKAQAFNVDVYNKAINKVYNRIFD